MKRLRRRLSSCLGLLPLCVIVQSSISRTYHGAAFETDNSGRHRLQWKQSDEETKSSVQHSDQPQLPPRQSITSSSMTGEDDRESKFESFDLLLSETAPSFMYNGDSSRHDSISEHSDDSSRSLRQSEFHRDFPNLPDLFVKPIMTEEEVVRFTQIVKGRPHEFPVYEWIHSRRARRGRNLQMNGTSTAMDICQDEMAIENEDLDFKGVNCTCSVSDESNDEVTLHCVEYGCQYCSKQPEEHCLQRSYGSIFRGDDKSPSTFIQAQNMSNGETVKLVLSFGDGSCEMFVNGIQCNSCAPNNECHGDDYEADCVNIRKGLILDPCQDDQGGNPSLLHFFDPSYSDEYGSCERFKGYERCLASGFVLDQEPRHKCSCKAAPGVTEKHNFMVECITPERCDVSVRDCVVTEFYIFFSMREDEPALTIDRFQVTRGSRPYSEIISTECDPENPGRCQQCTYLVDGQVCNSCEWITCAVQESTSTAGSKIDCRNLYGEDAVLSPCIQETFSEPFLSLCMHDRLTPGFEACGTDLDWFQKEVDPLGQYYCFCKTIISGFVEMKCEPTCGVQCNVDQSKCFSIHFYRRYHQDGTLASEKEIWIKHWVGSDMYVAISIFPSEVCQATVFQRFAFASDRCRSCEMQTCPNNERVPQLDCSNFVDLCEEVTPVVSGLFQFLDQTKFSECTDIGPNNDECSDDGDNPFLVDGDVVSGWTNVSMRDPYEICKNQPLVAGHWYKYIGTGRVVTVSTCDGKTSFDTQLQIYEGRCQLLLRVVNNDDGCLSGSNNPLGSAVSWRAKIGIVYSIRIAGRLEDVGNYTLKLVEKDTSEASCENLKVKRLSLAYRSPSCECRGNSSMFTLSCVGPCEHCNFESSACGLMRTTVEFNGAGFITKSSAQFEYTAGIRNKADVMVQDNFYDNSAETCQMTLNGDKCTSCSRVLRCSGQLTAAEENIEIDCYSIDGGIEFNSCSTWMTPPGVVGALYAFLKIDTSRCRVDPLHACASFDFRPILRKSATKFTDCECLGNRGGEAALMCENSCLYCSSSFSACGKRSERILFNVAGDAAKHVETFQYVVGRDELIDIESSLSATSSFCSAAVNGAACDSCRRVVCSDGSSGWDIDCPGNGALNSCDATAGPRAGIFQFMVDPAFQVCLDPSTTEGECLDRLESAEEDRSSNKNETCRCLAAPSIDGTTGFFYVCGTPDPVRSDVSPRSSSISLLFTHRWMASFTTILAAMLV